MPLQNTRSKQVVRQHGDSTTMNQKIPAADNMGIRQEGDTMVIPLACNMNDKGCLFAGSIFSGATLAGYRLAEKLTASQQLPGELVAKEASISYLKRIVSDGHACAVPLTPLTRKPNNNYTVSIRIDVCDSQHILCAQLTTEYILVTPRSQAH